MHGPSAFWTPHADQRKIGNCQPLRRLFAHVRKRNKENCSTPLTNVRNRSMLLNAIDPRDVAGMALSTETREKEDDVDNMMPQKGWSSTSFRTPPTRVSFLGFRAGFVAPASVPAGRCAHLAGSGGCWLPSPGADPGCKTCRRQTK